MILAYDVETTGLPLAGKPLAHPGQPRLVQLAFLLLEPDGTERASFCSIVNPGVPIPAAATLVHGIDDALAARAGISERAAVTAWHHLASRARVLVAHNFGFDWHMMELGWARGEMPPTMQGRHGKREQFCTMAAAAPILNLPPTDRMLREGFDKPKPPKLAECVRHFWGEDLVGAHDALSDVRACARIYFELQSRAQAVSERKQATA